MFKAKEVFAKMTLREKIAQTFLQYFHGYEDMPEKLVELNKKGELGNFIFFSGANVRNLDQLHSMTKNLQSHASENPHNVPFLMTIDQEGGQLTAIHKGTTMFPGNQAMGFANDQSMAYAQGTHVGKELRYAGINLCYAPVLDSSYDRLNGTPAVDNRTYSSQPGVVAEMGAGFIKSMQEAGVAACGKHFPGMRLTLEDTHFKCDTHPGDMQRLKDVELVPFQKAIDDGLEVMMSHHGIFPALDEEYPASCSKKWMDYLRNEMGFKGLIVTDDLVMGAVRALYGDEEACLLALNAGADLIMHTAMSDKYVDFIEECVNDGRVKIERVEEACLRILEYKERFCLEHPEEKLVNKYEGDKIAYEIAKKSLIKYKDDKDIFPLQIQPETKVGVVFGNPARLVMSDAINLYDKLSIEDTIKRRFGHENTKEAIMPWRPTHMELVSVGDIAIISDVTIFTTVNAFEFTEQLETLKYIRNHVPNRPLIGVATRGPDDAKLMAEYCDAVIVTGGLSQVTLDALVDAIFKDGEFDDNPAKKL